MKISKVVIAEVERRLSNIVSGGESAYGLCNTISSVPCRLNESRELEAFLTQNIQNWPEWNGDFLYPIGSGYEDYYDLYAKTAIGDQRRRLASHLLSRLGGVYGNAFGN